MSDNNFLHPTFDTESLKAKLRRDDNNLRAITNPTGFVPETPSPVPELDHDDTPTSVTHPTRTDKVAPSTTRKTRNKKSTQKTDRVYTSPLTLRLTTDTLDQLSDFAEQHQWPIAVAARRIIEQFLEKNAKKN